MNTILYLLLVTTLSGVVGTGLGGVIGALFKKVSDRAASLLLSFAAGVMLAIVCFDLVPEAIGNDGQLILPCIVGLILGVGVVYLLNFILDRQTVHEVKHVDGEHPKTHDAPDELIHADHYQQHKAEGSNRTSLFMAGVVMAFAIALHNIPEGMTIGAAAAVDNTVISGSALVLAVLIGLHNIPEGMAVSVPLINGGMGRFKAVLLTGLSGLPTVLGALLGYWIGDMSGLGLCLSLGFASGAMLYVVFGEILPQSILMYRSKLPAFFVLIGIVLGLLLIYVL